MPEYPDVTVYVERLRALTIGQPLEAIRIASPFVLRTVSPSPGELRGARVTSVERLGKRVVVGVTGGTGEAAGGDRFLVIHLMIAGRLRWKKRGEKLPAKVGLAAFDLPNGTLIFTEASPKKRASLHLVAGRAALAEFDRGGLDVFAATTQAFGDRLRAERHTIKRALTDPTLFDGIGNAYSDEILHAARLSPFRMTSSLTDAEVAALHDACKATLTWWTRHLRDEVGDGFPDKVTAFHPEMAVHGKYGQPCPVCGTKVQRIVYADNEANYCPTCQTEGRLLADRGLSRLLKEDWPRSLEELDERKAQRAGDGAGAAGAAASGATLIPAALPRVVAARDPAPPRVPPSASSTPKTPAENPLRARRPGKRPRPT
ncbi:MAG TPA: DNA-formamidopyrimidine glycosylase family protein [Kofleriaceae bacterium]|jgi:formamidopyrimidine-DNA glycosylase|nr:DNA-formamidopyrimidine glycosylase family protein [Kofleriaceae bacterium]